MRDTDTLLKMLKVSEEAREEERSRGLHMRNRLLNSEAKLLVAEQAVKQHEMRLRVREKDMQDLQTQSEAVEQAHASLKRDQARSASELDISKRDLEKAKREIANLQETQSSLEEQLADGGGDGGARWRWTGDAERRLDGCTAAMLCCTHSRLILLHLWSYWLPHAFTPHIASTILCCIHP